MNPLFYHLLKSSHQNDSNKWLNIGFGAEITQAVLIEVNFTHHIWSSETTKEIHVQNAAFQIGRHLKQV